MSYREENGQVVLTMSRDDYDRLLQTFAIATYAGMPPHHPINNSVVELLNRLNQGNPNYTPYQTEKENQNATTPRASRDGKD